MAEDNDKANKSDIDKAKDALGLVKDLLELVPEFQKLVGEKKNDIEVRDKLISLLNVALKLWESWAPLSREKKEVYGNAVDAIIDNLESKLRKIRELAEEIQQLLRAGKKDEVGPKLKQISDLANEVKGIADSLRIFQMLDKNKKSPRTEKTKEEKTKETALKQFYQIYKDSVEPFDLGVGSITTNAFVTGDAATKTQNPDLEISDAVDGFLSIINKAKEQQDDVSKDC
jgi:phage host-nuclease inhibitor protein Gam